MLMKIEKFLEIRFTLFTFLHSRITCKSHISVKLQKSLPFRTFLHSPLSSSPSDPTRLICESTLPKRPDCKLSVFPKSFFFHLLLNLKSIFVCLPEKKDPIAPSGLPAANCRAGRTRLVESMSFAQLFPTMTILTKCTRTHLSKEFRSSERDGT